MSATETASGTSREVAQKVRAEVGTRLEWYERVLSAALRFFGLVNGAGLATTVMFTAFLIQFSRSPQMAVTPAVCFALGLLAIALFHVGHAFVIRNWARGKLHIRRYDGDEFGFVDDSNIIGRLFSHLQLWPVLLSGMFAALGVLSGMVTIYRG